MHLACMWSKKTIQSKIFLLKLRPKQDKPNKSGKVKFLEALVSLFLHKKKTKTKLTSTRRAKVQKVTDARLPTQKDKYRNTPTVRLGKEIFKLLRQSCKTTAIKFAFHLQRNHRLLPQTTVGLSRWQLVLYALRACLFRMNRTLTSKHHWTQ